MSTGVTLPVLAERRGALETCGYCPKLCRAACPVSNAEPRDTITPWGKMTIGWLMARGDVAVDAEHARVAWACSGCFACRERCDHRNPVVETLTDVRAEMRAAGVAPAASERVVERHPERVARLGTALRALQQMPEVDASSPTALLIGCGYLLHAPEQARDVVSAAGALAGSVKLIAACCGAPLAWAGDRDGARRARAEVAGALAGATSFMVADPGCALELRDLAPVLLVDMAVRQLSRFRRLEGLGGTPLRWHDPCQLARGLGRYDEPRAVLTRLLGRAPDEFAERRTRAACSGAGSLLPITMPAVSAEIADRRLNESERLGGGTIVTACGASLKRFRSRGVEAVDLATLMARSLR